MKEKLFFLKWPSDFSVYLKPLLVFLAVGNKLETL